MARLSNRNLLAMALVLSVITSMLVYSYLKKAAVPAVLPEGVPVVMAKSDIGPKTRITGEMVQIVKVPPEYVQPGAVQTLERAVGVVARERISSGEQISERRLLYEGKNAGFTGIIPRDKRAVTVMVNEVTGVAGFIKAGDYTDVIVTFDTSAAGDHVSRIILQDILVLASNHDSEISAGDNSSGKDRMKESGQTGSVTLAVTADEAARLSLAEEKGKIRLALRPYLPAAGQTVVQSVTPKDLVGEQKGIAPAAGAAPAAQPPAPAPAAQTPEKGKHKTGSAVQGIPVIRGTKFDSE